MTKQTYFFKDKPVFGFDIGHGSLKVMQSTANGKRPHIVGYGTTTFDPSAIEEGVIVKPEIVAKATQDLFKHHLIGDITTNRTVIAIPAYRTYSRAISLPNLSSKELNEAVRLEAEQYIPIPLDEVYIDYNIMRQSEQNTEVFAIAVPKRTVDTQLELMRLLGLEVVGVETTITATGRLFGLDPYSDVPSVLIDFGSLSADISLYDKDILVSGTVPGGGEIFTNLIRDKLGVSQSEAWIIKTKYGLGPSKKQKQIIAALEPVLAQLSKEIARMLRYYDDRYGVKDSKEKAKHQINQIITFGGGANMPGIAEYLIDNLRLAVRTCDPWEYCDYHRLQPPTRADKPMYATVMGLSLINPKGLF